MAGGQAKFWLEPIVALADFRNFKTAELKEIEPLVQANEEALRFPLQYR